MNYFEAKKIIDRHDKVIVTGPQRSGTRITAKMIAHDKRALYIDEVDVKTYSLPLAKKALEIAPVCVMQCPGLSAKCHLFPENTLVVFMQREISEIRASEKRVGWEENEWIMYEDVGFKSIVAPISVYKYFIWRKYQRPLIKSWVELNYHSMRDHELWIPPNLRATFEAKQTEV